MKSHVADLKLSDAQTLLWSPDKGWKSEVTNVWIKDGKIFEIGIGHGLQAKKELSLKGLTLLPGLIDSQVHFREPGYTHKEDLETGTKSALLGGVTTIFEMPNTNPATTSLKELHAKFQRAENRAYTHYAFYSGGSKDNGDIIKELEAHPNSPGIKLFMGSSFGLMLVENDSEIEKILINSSRRVTVHCEDELILNENKKKLPPNPHVSLHPHWRSPESCLSATTRLVNIARRLGKKVHVLHVTTHQEVDFLSRNQDVATFEVLPQHLTLTAPNCYQELGTLAQQNPPIREKEHQERLWHAINTGLVSTLGSDHAPHTLEEKARPYPNSPSGMPGVQTIVPIMLNHVHEQRLRLERFVELMTLGVIKVFGLKNKGIIQPGFDADFTVVDLNKTVTLTNQMMATKSKWTPFHGKKVTGFPIMTILNGKVAMQEGEILIPPSGTRVEFSW
jgi:dihydroorotase